MNWGAKITVVYLAFVALILGLVITSVNNPSELEYKDYYARELKYQDLIDAGANAAGLSAPIEHSINGKTIRIEVPAELRSENTKGYISLLRPSDARLDCEFEFKSDSTGKQIISDNRLVKGVYKLSILLEKNHQKYYKEAVINLQ